jgi:predicted Rossmann fold nucleotide-binding protein DprA/Smf involved in DNA uptake
VTAGKKYTIITFREKTGAKPSQELLDLRRAQLETASKIMKALSGEPRTVPEIAKETGIEPKTVLWYLMTYYKYGSVAPAGKTGDGYYRYARKEKGGK